jgi:hypothetical protein
VEEKNKNGRSRSRLLKTIRLRKEEENKKEK